jgi:hypothetical protein
MCFIQISQWMKKLIVGSYPFISFHCDLFYLIFLKSSNYLTVSFKLYDMDSTGFIERKEVIFGTLLHIFSEL